MARRVSTNKLVVRWIVLTLGASVFAAVDGGWLARWTGLVPSRVWYGEIWRLVTWPWIQTDPLALLMTLAAMYKFGGDLAVAWGDRRLRRFVGQILIGASILTCLIGSAVRGYHMFRLGGWAVSDVLVIAWARQYPDRTLTLHGILTVSGRNLVRLTVASSIVFALFDGPFYRAPELLACFLAAAYPRGWLRTLNVR
jgi:membrane associated rhomboid family serine protease